MARSPNCTGAPTYRGRVDVTITYPDPDETLLETPVALPTSEPAEAQISYTLASGHMPVWSPYELEHVKVATLCASGRNSSSSTKSVYYRLLRNGVSTNTGSSGIAAGCYYTFTAVCFLDIAAGDVLSCKLWTENGTYDYTATWVTATRIGPADIPVHGIVVVANKTLPKHSNFDIMVPAGVQLQHGDVSVTDTVYDTIVKKLLLPGVNYRLLRMYYGDVSSPVVLSSGSVNYRPRRIDSFRPTRISYTPLNLRV